jgi:hypothetical protein
MNEKTLLENFKKHCMIAKDLKIYSKPKMIESLSNKRCPFTMWNFTKLNMDKSYKKRDKLFNYDSYWPTADKYEKGKKKPTEKMISILNSIWKK